MLHRTANNKDYYVPDLLKLSKLHLSKTKLLITALEAVHGLALPSFMTVGSTTLSLAN